MERMKLSGFKKFDIGKRLYNTDKEKKKGAVCQINFGIGRFLM